MWNTKSSGLFGSWFSRLMFWAFLTSNFLEHRCVSCSWMWLRTEYMNGGHLQLVSKKSVISSGWMDLCGLFLPDIRKSSHLVLSVRRNEHLFGGSYCETVDGSTGICCLPLWGAVLGANGTEETSGPEGADWTHPQETFREGRMGCVLLARPWEKAQWSGRQPGSSRTCTVVRICLNTEIRKWLLSRASSSRPSTSSLLATRLQTCRWLSGSGSSPIKVGSHKADYLSKSVLCLAQCLA